MGVFVYGVVLRVIDMPKVLRGRGAWEYPGVVGGGFEGRHPLEGGDGGRQEVARKAVRAVCMLRIKVLVVLDGVFRL